MCVYINRSRHTKILCCCYTINHLFADTLHQLYVNNTHTCTHLVCHCYIKGLYNSHIILNSVSNIKFKSVFLINFKYINIFMSFFKLAHDIYYYLSNGVYSKVLENKDILKIKIVLKIRYHILTNLIIKVVKINYIYINQPIM